MKKDEEESNYEENYTPLKELNKGDIFIDKANCTGEYIECLGEDNHLLKSVNTGKEYKVPHGNFPIFKKITFK